MKHYILFFFLILCSISVEAQVDVSGTVTDAESKPLPNIIIKNVDAVTKKMKGYTTTDDKGRWSIKAKAGSVLQFSAIGFKKHELTVKVGMGEQHVVLEDNAVALKEITVKAAPVHISGDTIKYLLSTFAKPEDRTLADVLTRVPGFEVNKDNGQISYEGKNISNFYIEGMDLMGGKYGVATKSLPQQDVASVEVMKHHQPIRVLDDFTYSDESAINIKMKKGAHEHWTGTFNGGGGFGSYGGLWNLETFAMRLKSNWQTLITYKTNNTGNDIQSETKPLFSFGELDDKLKPLIELPAPSAEKLKQRSLFNRTHAATVNTLVRLTDNSQMNVQVTYVHDRQEAYARRTSEYFVNTGNRVIDNTKQYMEKTDRLSAKLKYENNSGRQYIKNELSGDFNWDRQWLTEQGTSSHDMEGRLPEYTLKDNFMYVRRLGSKLITVESKNIMQVRPNGLDVDDMQQDINQHYYETDTHLTGSFRLGKFIVSGNAGVNAAYYDFSSHLKGLSDSLGLYAGSSRFSLFRVYATPCIEYKQLTDFDFRLTGEVSYSRYSYSFDNGYSRVLFSPELSVSWRVSPRWRLRANAGISSDEVDVNQFYPTMVLQDYQYISRGFADYRVGRAKSVGLGSIYSNAINGTHFILNVNRIYGSTPYTTSQEYSGKYIILSLQPQQTKYDSWMVMMMASQGISFIKSTLRVRALYNARNSDIMQNGKRMPFDTKILNLTAGLVTSIIPTVDLSYNLSFMCNNMDMAGLGSSSTINSWKHEAKVYVPVFKMLGIEATAEYYHNQVAASLYKDIMFADAALKLKLKHFDVTLALNNILNNKTYAYAVNSDLMRSTSSQNVRGRELMLSVYFKP